MNAYQTLAAGWSGAMDVLEGAHGKSVIDMCRDGFDTRMAKLLEGLAGVYFDRVKAGRKQAAARAAATAHGHTLFSLEEIEKWVKKLDHKRHAWEMRTALCQTGPVLRQIREKAKDLLAQFNGPEKPKNKPSLSARAIPGSTYMRFSADAPGHLVQAAIDALKAMSVGADDHPAETAMKILAGGGAVGAGPEISTRAVVRVDNLESWCEFADGDVLLSLTNGTRITGSEFLRANLSEDLRIVLVSPMHGSLSVYEGRFATEKMREAAAVEDPCCVIPGCGVGADYCETNHNIPYSRGGPTGIDNLSTMCHYDNGRLSDGRNENRFGSVMKVNGQNYYVPPFGGRPRVNDHPVARGGAMRIINN